MIVGGLSFKAGTILASVIIVLVIGTILYITKGDQRPKVWGIQKKD